MKIGDLIRRKWQGNQAVYVVLDSVTNAYVTIINESGQRVSVPKRHYELISRPIKKSLNKS
jgi:hypothetical protein